jgi:hypothetical protein
MTEQPPSNPPPPPGGYPPPPQEPGYPPPQTYGYPPSQAAGTNGMAIASLVCSLLGWVCGLGPILGIVFGFIALNQIRTRGQGGRGLAIAGIAIGAALILLGIIYAIVLLAWQRTSTY